LQRSWGETAMESRAGWSGSVQDCADQLEALFANGNIEYDKSPNDSADEDAIESNALGLKNLFDLIPKGNGRWTTFVKAILKLMSSGRYPGAPKDLKRQLKEAENQASILRTICFHIRREWYRRSKKMWMRENFPRPDNFEAPPRRSAAAASVAVVAVAEAPEIEPTTSAAMPNSASPKSAEMISAFHGSDWTEMDFLWIEDGSDDEWLGDDCDSDMVGDNDTMWHYGFDTFADKSRTAWRKLVDTHGEVIIAKENASHCTEPDGGVGLLVGHFLDGTSHAIPAMVWPIEDLTSKIKRPAAATLSPSADKRHRPADALRRPAAATKRPAAATKRPAAAPAANDDDDDDSLGDDASTLSWGNPDDDEDLGDEEGGEEELNSNPDEVVNPSAEEEPIGPAPIGPPEQLRPEPEALTICVGQYVTARDLEMTSLNGRAFKVMEEQRSDGRWLVAVLTEINETPYWMKTEKLTPIGEKNAMKYFKGWVEIGPVSYFIKGTSQGPRTPLVIVMADSKQFGCVKVQRPGGAVDAFDVAKKVLNELKTAWEEEGIVPTKPLFFKTRDRLLRAYDQADASAPASAPA
jgi:hypothetical protein